VTVSHEVFVPELLKLDVGAPGFPSPEHVKLAAIEAVIADETHYTPTGGTPAMKAAIRTKFARENGLVWGPDEVCAAAGAKPLIMAVLMATLKAGDQVIVPTPSYPAYLRILELLGVEIVALRGNPDDDFRISARELAATITDRTAWLLLNNPVNPTGAVYSREHLAEIADVLRGTDIRVLSDELYEHTVFEGVHTSFAALSADALGRSVTVNGVSKTYAMTGWRLGYLAASADVVAAVEDVLFRMITCPPSISQAAAVAALEGNQHVVSERLEILRVRRDRAVAGLAAITGVSCRTPQAGLYVFADISSLLGRSSPEGDPLDTARELCAWLRKDAGIALAPGDNFGEPGFLRLTFAVDDDVLDAGLVRLAEALSRLR
jgi:aspartate aminotransferase